MLEATSKVDQVEEDTVDESNEASATPTKNKKIEKWYKPEENMLSWLQERYCSRDLISLFLGRDKGLVYSKL